MPSVTRRCVEAYLNRDTLYDGHGLILPTGFTPEPTPPKTRRECVNAARWQDSANGGRGGWVTQVPDMTTNCFDVPVLLTMP